MRRTAWAKRLLAFVLVVAIIVAAAAAAPLVDPPGEEPREPLPTPEYDPADLDPRPMQTGGSVEPDVPAENRAGVVLVDTGHLNGVDRADVAPLVRGLTESGLEVRFHDGSDNLSDQLPDVDALVVIDPTVGYDREEVDAVSEFTDGGGRLLLVGEPDRLRVTGVFIVSLTTRSSQLSALASAHGVAFDTRYLYNVEHNDGNYKHVRVEAARDSPVEGVEAGAVYTGTTVSADHGTPLLVTAEGTRLSGGTEPARHTVAVRKDDVVAVGDATFLGSDRHTVGDNEAFVAYLVEFLAGA